MKIIQRIIQKIDCLGTKPYYGNRLDMGGLVCSTVTDRKGMERAITSVNLDGSKYTEIFDRQGDVIKKIGVPNFKIVSPPVDSVILSTPSGDSARVMLDR